MQLNPSSGGGGGDGNMGGGGDRAAAGAIAGATSGAEAIPPWLAVLKTTKFGAYD